MKMERFKIVLAEIFHTDMYTNIPVSNPIDTDFFLHCKTCKAMSQDEIHDSQSCPFSEDSVKEIRNLSFR